MADTIFFNVAPDFNLQMFAGQLAEKYRMEGFTVSVAEFNNSVVLTFDKNRTLRPPPMGTHRPRAAGGF